jgi:hypothetical protein
MTAPSPVLDPSPVYVNLEPVPHAKAPKQVASRRPQPPAAMSRMEPSQSTQ